MNEADRMDADGYRQRKDRPEHEERVGSHRLHGAHKFVVEPWRVREVGLDQASLAVSESVFTLSNGHIGVRGNLDENDPAALPGTYLASFYETRPLPYAESGYGYPESGQTVVNVTDGKLIRLLVDDEPLDLRYGEILSHERILDLRRGVLERVAEWCSPAGKKVRIRSTRLVSLTRRSLLAIDYRVEPIDEPLRVVAQSELVTNEPTPRQSDDPRVTAMIEDALEPVEYLAKGLRALLVHRTRLSKLQLATAMDHRIFTPNGHAAEITAQHPNWARVGVSTSLELGEQLRLVKFVAYGWSSRRSVPALRDQVSAALLSALDAGWDGVYREQEVAFADFWSGADVELDGPPEIQQAVRFGIFHISRPAPGRAARDRGQGSDRHRLRRARFWDTETFVLPVLTATAPQAAARRAALAAATPWAWHGTGPGNSGWPARRSRGGRSAARSARATGRPARPRSTSTPTSRSRRSATSTRPATRSSRRTRRCRCWWRRPGCGCRSGTPATTAIPHRRRDRPGRVHRDRRQQRLHEPDGAAEPARPRRRWRGTATRARRLLRRRREVASWRAAAGAMVVP